LWSDISHFQRTVTNDYPYRCLCIRSNDGGFLDTNFPANYAWCETRRASGKLFCFLVYYFYRPGVNGAQVLMQRCGKPDPRMVAMIDVESAGGQVTGNQSAAINAQHDQLAHWLGDARRVVGYGNVSDLNALWPQKPKGMRIIVAAYGSNPSYPGKYAHQFTDKANTPPFGPSDLNSADGMSEADLLHMYGFSAAPPAPPDPGRWRTWETKGNRSLAQIGEETGMAPSSILRRTVEKWGPFDQVIAAYVSDVFNGKMPPTSVIPAGGKLWVQDRTP
jgi:hypothetical protein